MRLYWSVQENVPVVSRRCAEREIRVVPTSKTSDPRPATSADLELLRRVVNEQFGSGTYNELIRSEVVLFGRVPYLDTAYEVISDGGVLGHLFFDLYEMRWYFKPLEQSIDRIGHRMEFLRGKIERRGDVVGYADDGPKFKLMGDGLAERVGDRYVVSRIFKPRESLLEEKSGWRDVLRINEPCILAGESRAIRFIWRISRRGRVIVSFSGGKDSSALLEVVRRSGIDYLTYFNDTGLELPETLSFVSEIGYDLLGEAKDSFWSYVGKFGPPARDYRWCCKVIKLLPTYRTLRSLAPGVTLVGQRRFESLARMRSQSIWRNRWLPGFLTGAPINEWSALRTWLYLRLRSVHVNPLYEMGFERLGCYLCPASRLSEFTKIEERYPELWERWRAFLSRYASDNGLDECWIRYGAWRWVDPPDKIRRLCSSLRRPIMTARIGRDIITMSPYDESRFLSLAPSIGELEGSSIEAMDYSITAERDRVFFRGDPMAVLKVGIRASKCAGCGLCEEYCIVDAIQIVGGRATIDPGRCTSCGICNEVCPLTLYLRKIVEIRDWRGEIKYG
ncbi:MAG: phosphoadenosine phosphosulfate reductase family protein [Candidatus Korarchaeota archaeon]|nr:phosphoadenosine phosphosulfate reductase family protein [Candidatus Korarchaeota archaeon]